MFLMSTDEQEKDVYREGARLKNQFIHDGALDMWRILEKFVEYFDDIYGDRDENSWKRMAGDILCFFETDH